MGLCFVAVLGGDSGSSLDGGWMRLWWRYGLEFGVDEELGKLSVCVVGNDGEFFVDIVGVFVDSSNKPAS